MVEIADLKFDIDSAVMICDINEEGVSEWSIDIDCKGNYMDDTWIIPRIYSEHIFALNGHNSWQSLTDKIISWQENYDYEIEEHLSGICCFEHLDIYNSTIKFEIRDEKLWLNWTALCQVFFGEDKYDKDVDLKINCPLKCYVYYNIELSEEENIALVSEYFKNDKFDLKVEPSEDYTIKRFVPIFELKI